MVTQAPSVMEIGSALENKEVTKSNKSVNVQPMIQQVKPVVDIVQFRQAYTKATNDGYKGKKSDFALQLEKEGVQVEGFEQYKDQMVKNSVAKDTRMSYFGMVANVLDQRYQNTKKQFARAKGMVENYDLTRDTPVGERLSKNVDVLKNWTATIGTPVGEGIASLTDIALNSIGRGIKAVTPDSVERYVTKQGKEIRETVKDKAFVQDAVGYLSRSAEEYNDWAMSNPDEAQILANVMNIADVALIGGGSKVAKEVVEGAGKKTMRMATLDEAKTMVQKKFKAVSDYVKMPKMGEVQDDLIDKFASKVGGLRQETIQTIRTNPLYEAVEKGELTRRGFGQEVLSAVEARRAEISELGSLYNNFRNPEIIVDLTPVKQNVKANILDKYKIKVTAQGLDFRNSKFANDTADQNAIKNAIDLITEDTLPADVALNRRQAISKMARFGSDVSGDGASVVREIRHQFNEQMHKDIKGLKAVDNQIAPEIQQIDSLVKDYYNKDGSIKDSFYSTITNIANKGKELKYDRLNKIIPDIDNRVSALKAFEDVENALNQKTGIYEKIAYYGSLFGVGTSVAGPLGGGAALLFGAKYADPKKIVEVLKKRGGAGLAVAEKLEANKALSAFDNEVIEKALRESGEQATDIATRGERRLPFLVDDSIEEVAQQPDNLAPQATQQLDNVATPTADLGSILQNATDEELKANGFTATMIKQFRKKNPLTKVGTTESATPSIAGKADEVLQTSSAVSKVDDALPVGEKMGDLPQKAKSLDSADLTKSIEKAKAEGKTVEEFVKSKAPKYMREYVDKDGVITEYRYYDHSYPKTFIAKKDIGEGIKKGDIVALVKEKNEINAIHSPYTKGGFKYTTERKVSLDDFTNVIEQTPTTPTPAISKATTKVDDDLLAEARKYKSADDWIKRFRDETYNATNVDTKIRDKAKEFNRKYVPLLEDGITKEYKENIQSIIEDITLDTDSMLEKIKPIKEKLYNYQKSQLRKIREEANKTK